MQSHVLSKRVRDAHVTTTGFRLLQTSPPQMSEAEPARLSAPRPADREGDWPFVILRYTQTMERPDI